MAKYIGTYTNETAIQTALNNNELNRPFVALANDTKQVYYGNILDLAQIGDIVVYDTARTSLRFIHLADYNTTTYPTATYEPIGVVCENQTETLASGVSDVKMLSKNWMDKANPDTGNANKQYIEWGDKTVQTNATSTTDGKANTTTVLNFATGQSDWQTASTITYTNGERMYPLFECAWRYHTSGTNQGDWYIGARDELNLILSDATTGTTINSGFSAIGASTYYISGNNGNLGSSTEQTSSNAYGWFNNNWVANSKSLNNYNNLYGYWMSRALYKGTILPM